MKIMFFSSDDKDIEPTWINTIETTKREFKFMAAQCRPSRNFFGPLSLMVENLLGIRGAQTSSGRSLGDLVAMEIFATHGDPFRGGQGGEIERRIEWPSLATKTVTHFNNYGLAYAQETQGHPMPNLPGYLWVAWQIYED